MIEQQSDDVRGFCDLNQSMSKLSAKSESESSVDERSGGDH
jgi:hypothetical protein